MHAHNPSATENTGQVAASGTCFEEDYGTPGEPNSEGSRPSKIPGQYDGAGGTHGMYGTEPTKSCQGFYGQKNPNSNKYESHKNFLTDGAHNDYRLEEAMYNFVLDLHVCGITVAPTYPYTIKWVYPWWWKWMKEAFKEKSIAAAGSYKCIDPPCRRRRLTAEPDKSYNDIVKEADNLYYQWESQGRGKRGKYSNNLNFYNRDNAKISPSTPPELKCPYTKRPCRSASKTLQERTQKWNFVKKCDKKSQCRMDQKARMKAQMTNETVAQDEDADPWEVSKPQNSSKIPSWKSRTLGSTTDYMQTSSLSDIVVRRANEREEQAYQKEADYGFPSNQVRKEEAKNDAEMEYAEQKRQGISVHDVYNEQKRPGISGYKPNPDRKP
jgi:hypothetical protein